ncbi:MAG: hypothetical protein IH939_00630 [Acidobacteria bacterium]|nr:hypothetical protein [Acidobacteriota bacterium]
MRLQTVIRAIVAYGALLLITACVPSLYPLCTDGDLVFDPGLVGTWIDDDDDTWTFEARSSGFGYNLTIVEDGVSADFSAHLVQLGAHRFLDSYPDADFPFDHDVFQLHALAVHTFWKLALEGETMRLVGLDREWLEDGMESGALSVTHSLWGDDNDLILLTA